MTECFIGIDTSNYTTSAAICTKEGKIVANLKMPLPVKAGECVTAYNFNAIFCGYQCPTATERCDNRFRPERQKFFRRHDYFFIGFRGHIHQNGKFRFVRRNVIHHSENFFFQLYGRRRIKQYLYTIPMCATNNFFRYVQAKFKL